MKYDLHSHSYYSDGSLSPTQLVQAAVEHGISHLALTDHDSLSGLPEARAAVVDLPIKLINGIEFSCSWNKQLLHIVGLNIDPNNVGLKQGAESNRQRRLDRAEAMYEDFGQHDINLRPLVEAQLMSNAVPTRPHFAQALVEAGYAKDKKQAFKRYLVRGKPGYIPMIWPSLQEVGAWITNAGGVAVLAHPMRYKFSRTKLVTLIGEMKTAGIVGMEISTATTDKQQVAMLSALAQQFNLLASTGSDFHSFEQHWARLGAFEPLPKDLTPVWTRF